MCLDIGLVRSPPRSYDLTRASAESRRARRMDGTLFGNTRIVCNGNSTPDKPGCISSGKQPVSVPSAIHHIEKR